jgi:hypothetical protein
MNKIKSDIYYGRDALKNYGAGMLIKGMKKIFFHKLKKL